MKLFLIPNHAETCFCSLCISAILGAEKVDGLIEGSRPLTILDFEKESLVKRRITLGIQDTIDDNTRILRETIQGLFDEIDELSTGGAVLLLETLREHIKDEIQTRHALEALRKDFEKYK